jgi:methionyl-tRNA formyltransferase
MRFAFAGIDFLGDVFQTLVDKGWEPVKLFTRPCDNVYDFNDVVVGRARGLRLPIQLSRIRPRDLAALNDMGCDALVVAGYPWLIKEWEEHLPYALNVHPSPLPEGRGPYPLFGAILHGAATWGVSIHKLAPTFDTGPVVAQTLFPLSPDETHDTLLAKCQMTAKDLAASRASDLPRSWSHAVPQGNGSYWPRITDRQRTIDWTRDVAEVLRTVRAFGSIEAMAHVGGKRLFVWEAAGWQEEHPHAPGTLVHKHRRHLVIAARDGFVQLTGWSALAPENARETGR